MITSHYYKNTHNTPIMCDWEYTDEEEMDTLIKYQEIGKLLDFITPEIKNDLDNLLTKLKKQKEKCNDREKETNNETKNEKEENSGLTN